MRHGAGRGIAVTYPGQRPTVMYEVSGLQYEEAQAARHRRSAGAQGSSARPRPRLCGFRSTAESTWAKCKYRGGDRRPPDAVVKRVLPEVSSDARESIQGTIRVAIRLSKDLLVNVAAGHIRLSWAECMFCRPGDAGCASGSEFRPSGTWYEWLLRLQHVNGFFVSSVL